MTKTLTFLSLTYFSSLTSLAEEPIKLYCNVNGKEYTELKGTSQNKPFSESVYVDVYVFSSHKSNVSKNDVTMISINSNHFKTPVINNLDEKVKKAIDNSDSSTWAIYNDQENEAFTLTAEIKIDRSTGIIKAYNHQYLKENGLVWSVTLDGKCEKSDSSKLKF